MPENWHPKGRPDCVNRQGKEVDLRNKPCEMKGWWGQGAGPCASGWIVNKGRGFRS